MPTWLIPFVLEMLTKLASWLYAEGLDHWNKGQDKSKSDDEIDAKLKRLKDAYKKAFDGDAVTKEEKDELKKALSAFLRSDNGGV